MANFTTSTGTVAVGSWGYVLQGMNGGSLSSSLLASATHDLLVVDRSRDGTDAGSFSGDEIARMKDGMGGRSVVVSYISIGEALDFRDYWRAEWTATGTAPGRLTSDAPSWLGPLNPDWPEGRKVRYWEPDWQDTIFNDQRTGDLDAIVRAGFDAAYLDIVDAYYFWGAEVSADDRSVGDPASVRQAAQRMVDFIVGLTEHARETNPDFFVIPQNGAWILDDLGSDGARREAYLDAIGGIAVEDLYYGGDADENNALNPDEATIEVLQRDFLANGKPVFAVDYVNGGTRVAEFNELAVEDGLVPFAAPTRDLDRLVEPHDGGPAYVLPTGGADRLRGSPVADSIKGLAGPDRIDGRAGHDTLRGNSGADVLIGGKGGDDLKGGSGADLFVFRSRTESGPRASNRDEILDFRGSAGDRVDLRGVDADEHVSGNQSFRFIGTRSFSESPGELGYKRAENATIIRGDVDGDAKADFSILLDGAITIGAADFLL